MISAAKKSIEILYSASVGPLKNLTQCHTFSVDITIVIIVGTQPIFFTSNCDTTTIEGAAEYYDDAIETSAQCSFIM